MKRCHFLPFFFLLDAAFLSGSVCPPHLLESSCLVSSVCAQLFCACVCACAAMEFFSFSSFMEHSPLICMSQDPQWTAVCDHRYYIPLPHPFCFLSSPNEQLCFSFRICHCEGDDESPLITPCHCTGSLHFVHQACLQQWIKSSDTRCCELCKYEFIMETKLKPLRKVGTRPASLRKCFFFLFLSTDPLGKQAVPPREPAAPHVYLSCFCGSSESLVSFV